MCFTEIHVKNQKKNQKPVQRAVPPFYRTVGVRLLGNYAANHTPKFGSEPGIDPPVRARVKIASVEGLDGVDPLVGSVADAFLIGGVRVCLCWQPVASYLIRNFSQSQRSETF